VAGSTEASRPAATADAVGGSMAAGEPGPAGAARRDKDSVAAAHAEVAQEAPAEAHPATDGGGTSTAPTVGWVNG